MHGDVATGQGRHKLAMVVIVATGIACAACIATPLAYVPSVLLQGLPSWLR